MSKTAVGKKVGVRNYDKTLLLNVVEAVRPSSAFDWDVVATRYFESSKDEDKRDPDAIKRYFGEKLCNNDKKPTGRSGSSEASDLILRAQRIRREILNRREMKAVGAASDDEQEDEGPADGADDFDITAGVENEEPEEEEEDVEKPPPAKKARKGDTKSKNCKITSTPRGSAAGALNNLATALASGGGGTNSATMMLFMMQQSMQQSNMMMMMMAKGLGVAMPAPMAITPPAVAGTPGSEE